MAIMKGRPNAGQGGKRGHSNMDHWEFTEEIKQAAKKRRRLNARTEIKAGMRELEDEGKANPTEPHLEDEFS